MNIRISKQSHVPLRQQIAAQIEFLIATGKLKPGDPLPSVRALARQLRIHHNTVSQAYQDVTSLHLLSGKHGSRLVVRMPEERAIAIHPDLDDLINQTIHLARRHGYTLQELSERVRERLIEAPPDHVLALSFDIGMLRLMKHEVEHALRCRVEICLPQELVEQPERALGALVIGPPGVLPAITKVLAKDRPVVPILFSSAESHLKMVGKLARPSIVAVVSVSEHLLEVARGLLGPALEARHTLVDCLCTGDGIAPLPAADVLFCDAMVFARLSAPRRRKNVIAYDMISRESLDRIAAMLPLPR